MPIVYADVHTCEKCGRVFKWNYFEPKRQRIESKLTVESIPHGITLVHSCHQRDNRIYDIEVNCPYCDFDNHFPFIIK